MANLDASTADALNALLEDVRASVEMEIAFANGATELNERETYMAMGGAEVASCCALRDLLTAAGAEVSFRINGIVLRVHSLDTYDDRLRAFVEHQLRGCEAAERLLTETSTDRIRGPLEEICQAHRRDAEWCAARADAFARSRLLDFRTDRGDGTGTLAEGDDIPGETSSLESTPPDVAERASDADTAPDAGTSTHGRGRPPGARPGTRRVAEPELE